MSACAVREISTQADRVADVAVAALAYALVECELGHRDSAYGPALATQQIRDVVAVAGFHGLHAGQHMMLVGEPQQDVRSATLTISAPGT